MSSTDRQWPCENCGADLHFAPGQNELRCEYCGHVQVIPDSSAIVNTRAMGELPLEQGLRDDLPDLAMSEEQTTRCPSCGALVEFQGAEHASRCPFCATPLVIGTGTNRQIKPQALVPFVLAEKEGRAAMADWLGSLWFAPNGLTEYARKGRKLDGIYVPYWTFDADTRSRYAGRRGDYYYVSETVIVDGKPRLQQVRKTRWTAARGWVARFFDDVLVLASQSLPLKYTEGLEPWDLTALRPYNADFLAGFTAEGYTVALADGHSRARDKMAAQIAYDVRRDIGGDEQIIERIDTEHANETFKHVLLPVWMAAYKYNGNTYRFVVNGQTGRVQGERPWSVWKITFAVVAAVIVMAAVAYLNQG